MRTKIRQLLQYSMNDVEQRWRSGWISDAEWRAYCAVWRWCAPRISNVERASDRQEAHWNNFGKASFYQRINKVRVAFDLKPIIVST